MKIKNLILLLVLILMANTAYSEISEQLFFRSTLLDTNKSAVADGVYTVTFSLWNGENETYEKLWEEQHNVDVKDGIYAVSLGSVVLFKDPNSDGDQTDALSFSIPYYLGIMIDNNDYMTVNGKFPSLSAAACSFRAKTSSGKMIKEIHSDYSVSENDDILFVYDNAVITLPSAEGMRGRIFTIKKVNPATIVSITTINQETIDQINYDITANAAPLNLTADTNEVTIISDGTKWLQLGFLNIENYYKISEIDRQMSEKVDGSNVYLKETIDEKLSNKADLTSLDLKADISNVYTKEKIDRLMAEAASITAINLKANKADVYTKDQLYTKTEINSQMSDKVNNTLLALKANQAVIYTKSQLYTQSVIDSQMSDKANNASVALKANSSDVYLKTEIDSQMSDKASNASVALKANSSDVYTKTEIDSQMSDKASNASVALKANSSDVYLKTEIDSQMSDKASNASVALKANSSDVYTKTEIDSQMSDKASNASVALKANSSDVYTKTEIDSQMADKASNASVALKANSSDVYTKT
ncbi:conserved hypothetical protein, secreted, partial [Candidatus Magnetomorum sp. HK-1]